MTGEPIAERETRASRNEGAGADEGPLEPSAFGDWVEPYRQKGYWPRPIGAGTKACPVRGWQHPDDLIPGRELSAWRDNHRRAGIGLLMGSPFPDGTVLAALDIDRDDYVRLGRALLGDPPCGRIGAKGIVLFARLRGNGKYRSFKVRAEVDRPEFKVGDLLCTRRLCVLPPTIHPLTLKPYRWVGKGLLDIDYRELPTIED